jgi:hypothetical protein
VERGEVAGVRGGRAGRTAVTLGAPPAGRECEEWLSSEGRKQGRSFARATRGLRRPSLDARSLAHPCYLPEENHRPQGREKVEEEDRMKSGRSMRAVRDSPAPLPTFSIQLATIPFRYTINRASSLHTRLLFPG